MIWTLDGMTPALGPEAWAAPDAQLIGRVVLEAIERVNRELGTLTVVITHNAAIGKMADRILHMADGRIEKIDNNRKRISAKDINW